MSELPKVFLRFQKEKPRIAEAYHALGEAVHSAGPLDERTRSLVKLAISVGSLREGAVHSHTRKAVAAGASGSPARQSRTAPFASGLITTHGWTWPTTARSVGSPETTAAP